METKPSHERYVFKPFVGSSHSWALEKALTLPPSTRVLDVGAGSGAIGSALKDAGFSDLTAIEIDEDARRHISSIYARVDASLEPFRSEKFDLIILLDVLEHFTNPFEEFQALCAMLSPAGHMLISVPNIAHIGVRLALLFGYFEYTERGLLDKTHLQFFTRKRLEEMVQSAPAMQVAGRSASIEPLELVLPEWVWDNEAFRQVSKIRMGLARLLPTLLGYQHLVMLENNG